MFKREKKYHLTLSSEEYRIIVNSMVHFRNELIAENRHTDALDELLLKMLD